MTLSKSSNTISKTPLGETGCLSIFLSVECLGIQFFDSPHLSSLTSSVSLPWAITRFLDPFYTFSPAHRRVFHDFALPTLFFSHVTYRTPWHARGHSHSLTLIPRGAEDFPRGGNHSKHMPPLTYLAWLQPMCYNSSLVFIHINTFTCGENFDKNIEQQPH